MGAPGARSRLPYVRKSTVLLCRASTDTMPESCWSSTFFCQRVQQILALRGEAHCLRFHLRKIARHGAVRWLERGSHRGRASLLTSDAAETVQGQINRHLGNWTSLVPLGGQFPQACNLQDSYRRGLATLLPLPSMRSGDTPCRFRLTSSISPQTLRNVSHRQNSRMARSLVSLIANSRSNVCNCFSSCIRRVKSLESFCCSRLSARSLLSKTSFWICHLILLKAARWQR